MTAENNFRIIEEYLAEHDPSLVDEDAVLIDQSQPDPIKGPDAIAAMLYDMYHVAFPGAEATITRISSAEDAVTLEFTFSGRNDGPFMGRPATGREVSIPMCAVYEMAQLKIVQIRLYYDSATMARQLGNIPEQVGPRSGSWR